MRRQVFRDAPYETVAEKMRAFTEGRNPQTQDELWQVEHQPVFTLGQAAKESHILSAGDIPVVRTERGGQVTYHGPGQVVVYTLIDIRRKKLYVRDTVCRLEQALIDTLADLGVGKATRKSGAPGVYVPCAGSLAKIAALGLKVFRGSTYHGVALNVAMDLSPFKRINPCGYSGLVVVDMATMNATTTDWTVTANRLCLNIERQLA